MTNKFTIVLAVAGVATAVNASVPASAQDDYRRDGYHQRYQNEGSGYDQGRYDQDARYQNYRQQREYQRQQQRSDQYNRRAEYERQY